MKYSIYILVLWFVQPIHAIIEGITFLTNPDTNKKIVLLHNRDLGAISNDTANKIYASQIHELHTVVHTLSSSKYNALFLSDESHYYINLLALKFRTKKNAYPFLPHALSTILGKSGFIQSNASRPSFSFGSITNQNLFDIATECVTLSLKPLPIDIRKFFYFHFYQYTVSDYMAHLNHRANSMIKLINHLPFKNSNIPLLIEDIMMDKQMLCAILALNKNGTLLAKSPSFIKLIQLQRHHLFKTKYTCLHLIDQIYNTQSDKIVIECDAENSESLLYFLQKLSYSPQQQYGYCKKNPVHLYMFYRKDMGSVHYCKDKKTSVNHIAKKISTFFNI